MLLFAVWPRQINQSLQDLNLERNNIGADSKQTLRALMKVGLQVGGLVFTS